MLSWRVGQGEFHYLTVGVAERPDDQAHNPQSSQPYDVVVGATIEFAVGDFHGWYRGRVETALYAGDLLGIRSQLAQLYSFESNQAMFSPTLGDLTVEIKGDRRGNFEAVCSTRSGLDGNCQFTLRFDQTELPRMMRELNLIGSAYPELVTDRRTGRSPIRINRDDS